MRRGWFGSVAVLVIGCSDPFAPVGTTERLTPPPEYRQWYDAVAVCAGLSGDFDAVTWEVADSLTSETWPTRARWQAPHTISVRRDHLVDESTIKHEELHDLLQTTDHPAPPFNLCENQH